LSLLETFSNKKVYVVTDADLDGVNSHIIAKIYLEPIVQQFLFTLTSKRDMSEFLMSSALDSDIIIFVDIAPTNDLYLKLQELEKQIYIYDHHITSYNDLMAIVTEKYYFTEEKCGCKIFFDELTKNHRTSKAIFQFVQLTDTYDRFQKKSLLWKDAQKLQDIMYEYVDWNDDTKTSNDQYNKYINIQLEKIEKGKNFYFTQYEEILAKNAEEKKRRNLEVARKSIKIRKDNSGNNYAYFECNSKLSIIGNIILDEYDILDYVIGHSTYEETWKNKKNGKISLRSKGSFTVNNIAKLYNGGGHPQSAGVELEIDFFEKLKKGEVHLI
jgi:oligoribonuclease NrnB/cAMP/cGMP phosphodiesterase (DHH superfamily)